MKVEIEVSEDDIKRELQKKVHEAIRDKLSAWTIEAMIKKAVHDTIGEAIIPEIERQLKDSDRIKESIRLEIERKLKRKITALMNLEDEK
jgi:uncharacterized membrane-anchored protein YjiN (DUF445 family)